MLRKILLAQITSKMEKKFKFFPLTQTSVGSPFTCGKKYERRGWHDVCLEWDSWLFPKLKSKCFHPTISSWKKEWPKKRTCFEKDEFHPRSLARHPRAVKLAWQVNERWERRRGDSMKSSQKYSSRKALGRNETSFRAVF